MENREKIIENRKGRKTDLGVGINSLIHDLDFDSEETKKIYRTAKVFVMFKNAIQHIYKDKAFLILQKINAVYILNERDKGMLKTAASHAKKIKRLIIYTCDSMVYADLDSRQENIKFWFANHGERIDKLELISSKFNMRRRFPYKDESVQLLHNFEKSYQNEIERKNDEVLSNPQKLAELKIEIDKINSEKLRNALNNLVQN